jgi:ribonuclease Z
LNNSKKIIAYSGDTAPSSSVVNLARGADILIHEAAGASPGHSSAYQAGEIAKEAGVKKLYLIHFPTNGFDYKALTIEAAKAFGGTVEVLEDFMEFEF